MEAVLELLKSLLGEWWAWTILAFFIAKFVPDETLGNWGYNIGRWITLNGNKFLKFIWAKLEEWLLHSIFGVFIAKIKEGVAT